MAPDETPSQTAAAVVSDFVQAWIDEVQHFYDNVRGAGNENGFSVKDAWGETSGSIDRLLPIAKRGIDLSLELLRPWASAFQNRTGDA